MQLTDDETINKNADRVLERVSPSQIEAFELCPRRWYNKNVRGFKELTTEAAQRGVDIGAEAEYYYKEGSIRVEARYLDMVEPVLKLLGLPRPTVTVEEWVEAEAFPGGPLIRGRYDHFDNDKQVRILGTEPVECLSDIKSRSDFRYAKTPEELAVDLQLNAYARPLAVSLGLEKIALQHVYTRTKKNSPKGLAVATIVTREQLDYRWNKTVESVKQMAHWARERPKTADPLAPNTAACSKFPPLGCPHKALCGFGEEIFQIRRNNMSETTNGSTSSPLMERLKAQQAAALAKSKISANPKPEPVLPKRPNLEIVPPPTEPTAWKTAPSTLERVKEKIALGFLRFDQGSDQVFDKDGADSGWIIRKPTDMEREALGLTKVVSADAPPRTNQPGEVEAVTTAKRGRPKKKTEETACETVTTPTETIAAPTMTTTPAMSVPTTAPTMTTTVAQVAPTTTTKETTPVATAALPGPVVYVNCIPVKGEHKGLGVLFEEWMTLICEEVAAQHLDEKGRPAPVADWRLIQYVAKGELAAAIRKYVSTCPPVVLVSKFSPAADVFLEVIIPHAAQIIQGV